MSQTSTAFQGDAQRVRVNDWLANANFTIATYGEEYQFTGRPDMLFSRFEKYVDMVFSNAPSALHDRAIVFETPIGEGELVVSGLRLGIPAANGSSPPARMVQWALRALVQEGLLRGGL